MAPTSTEGWADDLLGAPYTARTLDLGTDDEGPLVATLVHRRADGGTTRRAILHVHGFADYFFQTVAADHWCARGYDFYALDLRKYGRSLGPRQTPNYITDLSSYYAELDLAWSIVREHHDLVVVSGHSTGGLTVPLWAHDRRPDLAGVVLNAPWLDMQGDAFTREVAMPVIEQLARVRPHTVVPRRVSGFYARSLHADHDGEWSFDLGWKPLNSWPVYAGWIAAIRAGQRRVAQGLEVPAPVLVLSSARSGHPDSMGDPAVHATDIVLDVEQIRRRAPLLGRHVTLVQIEGARHDVTLSRADARAEVFDTIDRFRSAFVEG